LRKSKDFSAGVSCGFFAPLEVINFAVESPPVSLRSYHIVMSPDLRHAHQVLNL
jgi:hypothetical protein